MPTLVAQRLRHVGVDTFARSVPQLTLCNFGRRIAHGALPSARKLLPLVRCWLFGPHFLSLSLPFRCGSNLFRGDFWPQRQQASDELTDYLRDLELVGVLSRYCCARLLVPAYRVFCGKVNKNIASPLQPLQRVLLLVGLGGVGFDFGELSCWRRGG